MTVGASFTGAVPTARRNDAPISGQAAKTLAKQHQFLTAQADEPRRPAAVEVSHAHAAAVVSLSNDEAVRVAFDLLKATGRDPLDVMGTLVTANERHSRRA